MITVLGACCNLLLQGFSTKHRCLPYLIKDFLFLGLLVTVAGVIYLDTVGGWILADKKSPTIKTEENVIEYVVEMIEEPHSHLIGETITNERLRSLKDIYLFEINRKA
jgi:hypothetical protein